MPWCRFVAVVHLCVLEPNLLSCPSSLSEQPNTVVERSPVNTIQRKNSMFAEYQPESYAVLCPEFHAIG
jgi:hypothetical protein